ncbi:MAG: S1 RNA-binding domain-containing protein, partial [Anaerolineae bacterium]|nr:S1 RNA-binding domain-containing protein [Anaerolineae bacterium]
MESEHEELKNDTPKNEPVSMENLEEEGALDLNQPRRGQLREGKVMEIRPEGLLVDIDSKLDGFVPASDLEELPEDGREFTVGQTIPVVVVSPRDHDGNVQLSVSQARLQEDWLKAEKLKEDEAVYETKVLESNRGGLTVEFGRLRGFVPMSQLIGFSRIHQASERFRRLNAMVDKQIMLKVIEVNRQRRRLILSQRAASKEWRAARRQRLLEELEAGQIHTGRISQITNFGLFVNLGGLDGLVHVSELSWGRVENPADAYRIGQRIKVKVLNVDRERQRIALSIKSLTPDPWDSVPERYKTGDLIEGQVNQIADFGVFVELEPGVEGLLHNSELATPEQLEELAIGSRELMKIIRIEPERRRIGLSVRQVRREEWEQWAAKMETARVEAEAAKAAKEAARAEAEAARAAKKAARAEAEAAKAAKEAAVETAGAAVAAEVAEVVEEAAVEAAGAAVAAEVAEVVEETAVEAAGAAVAAEVAETVEETAVE